MSGDEHIYNAGESTFYKLNHKADNADKRAAGSAGFKLDSNSAVLGEVSEAAIMGRLPSPVIGIEKGEVTKTR